MKYLYTICFGFNLGLFAAAFRPECGVSPRDVAPTLVLSALFSAVALMLRGVK